MNLYFSSWNIHMPSESSALASLVEGWGGKRGHQRRKSLAFIKHNVLVTWLYY